MKPVSLDEIHISNTLEPGDLGYIIHLHGKIYGKEYGYGPGFESYVASSLLEFYNNYQPHNNRVWICKHEKTMIGCLILMNRGEAAQLRYFIIEPAYRGIGLGKKLMELFMKFLKECNYRSSYLLTTGELKASAYLYKSSGFTLTEEKASFDNFGKDVVEQRYDLKIND
ncbi:MAG: GNAT family N-acetyltransferase [Cyclobacteriaceae bacterium]|nr:GNAT family N-acetyltransferase [Cyclobacteriaceae bacterium]